MEEAKVIFILDGIYTTIHWSKDNLMGDICQKYTNIIEKNIDSLSFFYHGKKINFDLTFNFQANSMDKNNNEMIIIVYNNEIDVMVCL